MKTKTQSVVSLIGIAIAGMAMTSCMDPTRNDEKVKAGTPASSNLQHTGESSDHKGKHTPSEVKANRNTTAKPGSEKWNTKAN